MRDIEYEALLNVDRNFRENEQYQYLEATETKTSGELSWTRGQLNKAEVPAWLNRPAFQVDGVDDDSPVLRILITRGDSSSISGRAQLQCSREVYKAIEQAWGLPYSVLKILLFPGLHLAFSEANNSGLAFRTRSSAFGGCVVVYDQSARSTSVLCDTWADDWQTGFLSSLQAVGRAAQIPSYILLMQLRLVFQEYQAMSQDLYDIVTRIGINLKIDPFLHDRVPDSLEDFSDLAKTTQELTKLAQQAAQMKSNLEVHQEIVVATHTIHEWYCNAIQNTTSQVGVSACSKVESRLHFLTTNIREEKRRVNVQVAWVQAQIQTVYSLVGSRDNKLNYKAAEASRRDSSDMRVIAWVTLGFLPATFAATFFSTTFFDWRAPNWEGRVSRWIWIYCVVSIGLTISVILMWRFTSKAVEKKTAQLLRAAEKHEKPASVYDEDGDLVLFPIRSHDLGGEVQMQAWDSSEVVRQQRANSGSLQAVGGAESV